MDTADVPDRINFGCGYDHRPGYLNVDSDPACNPDILVDHDLSGLPRGHFREMLALDVLEHIDRTATPSVLFEWADMLQPGGRLLVKTSSIEGVARQILRARSFRAHYEWTHFLFGTQAHPGDYHRTGFTETTLRVHLEAAGLSVGKIWLEDRWLIHADCRKEVSWREWADTISALGPESVVDAAASEVLGRSAEPQETEYLAAEIESGRLTAFDVVRHYVVAPERLYVVASRLGLDRRSIAERHLRPRDVVLGVRRRTVELARRARSRLGPSAR